MKDLTSKCPVMHGAATTGIKGTTNSDWWPNQLNLNILRQHDQKSNPLGDDFDYRDEFLKIDFFKNKLNLSDSILISTVPPNEKDEDFILKNIPVSNLKSFSRIIYISSTSVYQSGDVNELTIPAPTTKLGIRRLSIEKEWQKTNDRYHNHV